MYKDAAGSIIYSNVTEAPPKNSKKIRCFKEAKTPANTPAQPRARSSDDEIPSVDRNTQRRRDDERRRILEEELAEEQQRLAEARQQLQEQESVRTGNERNYQRYLDRVQPFRETVENHERNVQAIQREISNLR